MILKIPPAASGQFVPCDRELDQPEPSKNFVKAVHIVGREGLLVLAKVLGDLMHLGRLIHRTTYEEYPFSHPAPPSAAWAHGGHSPGADDSVRFRRRRKLWDAPGSTLERIGLVELNEAFAIQALAVMQELGLRHEITNVNGGAFALGHPLGCSGARILSTLLHEMRRRSPVENKPYYGLATLCVGVGQGEATILEYLDH